MNNITEGSSEKETEPMTERRTWDEFREWDLLWWVNRILHLFGWVIAVNTDCFGKVTEAYPARCRFRGFTTKCEVQGFRNLTRKIAEEHESFSAEILSEDES